MKGARTQTLSLLIVAVTGCVVAVTGCVVAVSTAAAAEESIIRVKGANSMANFVDSLAKAFMKKHPGTTVVVSGGGSQVGMGGLIDKTVEVAMSAIPISEAQRKSAREKGLEPEEKLFGWGGVAVFVHPSNPVGELTREQLRKLFNGDFASWADVGGADGPVKAYTGELPGADSAVFFQSYVMKGDRFKPGSATRRHTRYVVKAVAEDAQGIGVASLATVNRQKTRYPVKPIGVAKNEASDAVLPSEATVTDRTYLLIRPLFLYFDGKAKDPMIGEFVNHCFVYGMAGKARGQK